MSFSVKVCLVCVGHSPAEYSCVVENPTESQTIAPLLLPLFPLWFGLMATVYFTARNPLPKRTIHFRMSGKGPRNGVSMEKQHPVCGLSPLGLTRAQAVPAPCLGKIMGPCQLSTGCCTSRKILHKGEYG